MEQEEHNNTGADKSLSQSSGIDEQLLARNNSQKEGGNAADRAIKKQRSSAEFRRVVYRAKRQKMFREKRLREEEKKKKKEKKKDKPTAAKKATASWLKAAWLNVIDTFGLTLIYINIHAWLSGWLGSIFCQLGDEWTMGAKARPAKKATKSLRRYEKMGLATVDLGCCSCILLALLILSVVAAIMTHPLSLIWEMTKDIGSATVGKILRNE